MLLDRLSNEQRESNQLQCSLNIINFSIMLCTCMTLNL